MGLVSFGFVGDWDWCLVLFFVLGVAFPRGMGSKWTIFPLILFDVHEGHAMIQVTF